MAILFVATSKAQQEWGADVGLGKNLYKVGVADGQTPDEAVAGCANQTDWKVLKTAEAELTEEQMLEKLGRREKLVDPNYYPKLRGALGIVKANLPAIENNMLVALALDGKEPPKTFKVKPVDVASYLINNATK
ncbi:MAG TPA: hypothetical protein VL974_03770 [Magnetospirillum sp.]|jgi:hypothetical protein|nr:hypothetical protein [Magnetospirillum sp.]